MLFIVENILFYHVAATAKEAEESAMEELRVEESAMALVAKESAAAVVVVAEVAVVGGCDYCLL